jgi:hypothetical protein
MGELVKNGSEVCRGAKYLLYILVMNPGQFEKKKKMGT